MQCGEPTGHCESPVHCTQVLVELQCGVDVAAQSVSPTHWTHAAVATLHRGALAALAVLVAARDAGEGAGLADGLQRAAVGVRRALAAPVRPQEADGATRPGSLEFCAHWTHWLVTVSQPTRLGCPEGGQSLGTSHPMHACELAWHVGALLLTHDDALAQAATHEWLPGQHETAVPESVVQSALVRHSVQRPSSQRGVEPEHCVSVVQATHPSDGSQWVPVVHWSVPLTPHAALATARLGGPPSASLGLPPSLASLTPAPPSLTVPASCPRSPLRSRSRLPLPLPASFVLPPPSFDWPPPSLDWPPPSFDWPPPSGRPWRRCPNRSPACSVLFRDGLGAAAARHERERTQKPRHRREPRKSSHDPREYLSRPDPAKLQQPGARDTPPRTRAISWSSSAISSVRRAHARARPLAASDVARRPSKRLPSSWWWRSSGWMVSR